MDNGLSEIKKMHQEEGRKKIQALQKKIDTTKYNIEVSKEIMDETASDQHADTLRKKNTDRKHAIAGLQKEIRDIEQILEQE